MNIALQILKEFWLPLCLSALWVAYNLFGGNGEAWDAKKVVNIFGPTFFFFSWLTGQFFRVKKQVKVENSLGSMEKRLERLFEELETKTRNMIDHVSGGNSFPWIQIGMVNSATDKGTLMVHHNGEHLLYDVSVRIVNLNKFRQLNGNISLSTMQLTDTNKVLGNLIPGHSVMLEEWELEHAASQDYNVFFFGRNGGFTQAIRMRKIGGEWVTATRITNRDNEVLHEQIDAQFPLVNDAVDWA